MKTDIRVKSLAHEDLVNIFSTAFYGCDWLQVDYDRHVHHNLPENKKEGRCYEDALADMILSGNSFIIFDLEAEGEVYGDFGKINFLTGEAEYEITLKRILKGCSTEEGFAYLKEILSGEGDYYTANNLMQIIMFGEVVYG